MNRFLFLYWNLLMGKVEEVLIGLFLTKVLSLELIGNNFGKQFHH